ncbi:hypothetical protein OFC37_26650, partial [Escherichia coli]|nr:hypothetical protein [Escherichia coli]
PPEYAKTTLLIFLSIDLDFQYVKNLCVVIPLVSGQAPAKPQFSRKQTVNAKRPASDYSASE